VLQSIRVACTPIWLKALEVMVERLPNRSCLQQCTAFQSRYHSRYRYVYPPCQCYELLRMLLTKLLTSTASENCRQEDQYYTFESVFQQVQTWLLCCVQRCWRHGSACGSGEDPGWSGWAATSSEYLLAALSPFHTASHCILIPTAPKCHRPCNKLIFYP
jgi:hypothetical protein